MKFFSLNKSKLSQQIISGIAHNDCDANLTIDRFSDGELCPIFRESVRDHHLFIIADGHSAEEIMKLMLTVDAAKRSGAKKITVIYPYLPYSRQDKNDHIRSSIGAKMLANMLQNAGVTRLITLEMHSPSIQGFYDIPVIHLYGNSIFRNYVKSLGLTDVTVCPPDHGALKRNAIFAKYFTDSLFAITDKKRTKPNEVASMTITGEENIIGRNVVCIDDMGDTLGTLCKQAELVMNTGALTFRAFLTHPVMSGEALKRLFDSKITELVVSDTIVSVYEKLEQYENMLFNEAKLTVEEETGYEICYVDNDEGKSAIAAKLIEIRAKRPKFTIVSCSDLLVNSIDRLMKKQSINELNIA